MNHSKTGKILAIRNPDMSGFQIPFIYCTAFRGYFIYTFINTVGAQILNKFGIRMIHSHSVQVPTIRKPNYLLA